MLHLEGKRKIINEKFTSVIIKIIGVFLIAMFGFLSFISLVGTTKISLTHNGYKEYAYLSYNNYFIIGIMLIIFLAALFLFDKYWGLERIPTKKLKSIGLKYILIMSSFWVLLITAYPINDQSIVFKCAKEFLDNNYSALQTGGYLNTYPFQLGIVWIFQKIENIFGTSNDTVIMVINVLCITGCFYLLFRILEFITNDKFGDGNKNEERTTLVKKIHNMYWIMSFVCLPPMLYCIFVYGTIIGLFLTLASIYFIFKFYHMKKIRHFVFSYVLISFAIIAKENFKIYAIAIVLLLLFNAIKERKLIYVLFTVIMCTSMFSPKIIYSHYEKEIERSNYEEQNNVDIKIGKGSPASLHIAMGLQDTETGCGTPGWYNAYNIATYNANNYNTEAADKEAKKYISTRMKEFKQNPGDATKFFFEKVSTQWSEPTFQTFWMVQAMENYENDRDFVDDILNGKTGDVLYYIMKIFMILIYVGNLMFFIFEFKKMNIWKMFLPIITFGGFIFSAMWEAKALYNMPFFMISIITGVWGIVLLNEKMGTTIGAFIKNKIVKK